MSRAQENQAYIAEHNVEGFLTDLARKLTQEKPDSPADFVAELLGGRKPSAEGCGDVSVNGHPCWHRPQQVHEDCNQLVLLNSLTDTKMPFIPMDGNIVKWSVIWLSDMTGAGTSAVRRCMILPILGTPERI